MENDYATDAARLATLQNIIGEQLSSEDIQSTIRTLVSNAGREEDAKNLLSGSGIIEKLSEKIANNIGRSESDLKGLRNSRLSKSFSGELHKGMPGRTQSVPLLHQNAPALPKNNRRYLLITIPRGLAFLGLPDVAEDATTSIEIHMRFRDQRFSSSPVMSSTEPIFNCQWLLELPNIKQDDRTLLPRGLDFQHGKGGRLEASLEESRIRRMMEGLLGSAYPIEVLITRCHHPSNHRTFMGSRELDWRECLGGGVKSKVLEVKESGDMGVTVGVLEVFLEMLPRNDAPFAESDVVALEIEQETKMEEQKKRIIYSMTKQWWNDFLQIRASHSERLVKILARGEDGERRFVCSFLQPVTSRYIESPRHAARFVSLIGVEKRRGLGNTETDIWHSLQTILTISKLPPHCHALLLTSLLLGLSLNAYMTLGSSKTSEAAAWVTTISSMGVVEFWDPVLGTRWLAKDVEAHGYRTVGCLFSHEVFYANANVTDSVKGLDFDLARDWVWKPIPKDAAAMSRRRTAEINFPILPFQMTSIASSPKSPPSQSLSIHEEDLESILKQQIAAFREDYDMRCLWDDDISRLLSQCLWGCEMGRLLRAGSGGSMGGSAWANVEGMAGMDFQESVKRTIPEGCTFKGFPCQFTTLHPSKMFSLLVKSNSCKDLMLTRGDKVRYAVRVRIFPYAERVMSCWVMVGVRFRPSNSSNNVPTSASSSNAALNHQG